MAVSIATHETGPYPHHVTVTLSCDVSTDVFCQGHEVFISQDGFIGAHVLAMKAGWLERASGQGRLWLCPKCSGKAE